VVEKHSFFEKVTASVALGLSLSIGLPVPRAHAGPEGAHVAHGQVSIQQNGDVTTIQASHNSVINYKSFDIQRQETVQFVQPNQAARVLNRVLGIDPTKIDGALLANGQVYILNPQGVFFGGTAVVDVHQLVAGAGSMTDADFLSGIDHLTDIRGEVANFGAIHADVVKLIGEQVANHGSIVAPGGVVMLVAGSAVYLAKPGERLVVKLTGVDAAKAQDGAGVTNTGTVDAGDGGVVFAAGDLYSVAVQHSGTTRARDIAIEGGAGGLVSVSGTLDASDARPGGTGGSVKVTGDRIAVPDARIDVSGDAGGGTVFVGGDHRGQGETPHAFQTYVGSDAAIHADAGTNGDGGKVVVWADGATHVDGKLTARGGAQGGDGGLIETSGANLRVTQAPDAGAPHGAAGTWRLDPENVNIVNAYTTPNPDPPGPPLPAQNLETPPFTPTVASSEILDTTIEAALEGGTSVTVDTNVDLGVDASGVDLNEPGSITQAASATIEVDDPTIGAGVTLTLAAANDITMNGGVLATGGRAVNVTLRANDPAQAAHDLDPAAGSVAINAPIVTNGGDFEVTATTGVSSTGAGTITTAGLADSGVAAGLVDVKNLGAGVVDLQGAIDTTGAANANLNGSAGGAVTVTSENGALTVGSITTSGGPSTYPGFDDPADVADVPPGKGGDGGEITLTRNGAGGGAGDLTVAGPLTSESGVSAAGGAPAAGGNVNLASTNHVAIDDAIRTHGGTVTATAGKAVTSNAGANVTTTARDDTGRASGRIAITAGTTVLLGGGLVSEGAANANANGSDGGNVDVTAKNGRLAVSTITTSGGQSTFAGAAPAPPGNGGNGGAITLTRNDGAGGGAGGLVVAGPLTSEAGGSAPGAAPAVGGAGKLDSVKNVTVNGTTSLGSGAFSSKGVTFTNGAAISADTISIEHSGDVNVNANLTATQASPSQPSLSVRSGNDGTGDLKLGPAVTLSADSTRLRAGSGSGTTAFVALGTAELTGAGGGATNPTVFEHRQDKAILAADSAAVDRFGANNLDGLAYTLRSDGGDVTLDAAKVKGSALTVAAKTGSFVNVDAPLELASLTAGVDDAAGSLGVMKLDSAAPTPSITTAQGQLYVAPVQLAQDWLLQSTANAPIAFNGTLNGPADVKVTTSGLTSFEAAVGGITPLASLTTDGGGTTAVNGAGVKTVGDQTYDDAVTVDDDPNVKAFESTNGGVIAFNRTLDGAADVVVTTAGLTSLQGAVGGITPLASLTTSGDGTTAIHGGTVTTTNGQSYGDGPYRERVTLGTGVQTLTSTANALILFRGPVDGAGGLIVTTGGVTSFQDAVGETTPLASLTTNGGNTTAVNGAGVKTVGAQTYDDTVTVDGDPNAKTFESTDRGAIAFNRTLDGPADVVVTTGGLTSFQGPVGGTTPLASLKTNGRNTTAVNGAGVKTTGDQTYDDAVTVDDDPKAKTFESTNGGAIAFNGALDGATDVTVTTAGLTSFRGAVGWITPLASLMTNGGNTTAVNGAGITTAGDQTYDDGVTAGDDPTTPKVEQQTLQSTDNGTIAFNRAVDGPGGLIVTTGGLTTFAQTVGGDTALESLTTNGGGGTVIRGAGVTTRQDQSYADAVRLDPGAKAFESTDRGAISFGSTLNGPADLLVTTGGVTSFQDAVGGTAPLATLTTNGGGTTAMRGGAVTTSGAQRYGDTPGSESVTLGTGRQSLRTANAPVTFSGPVNGPGGLEVEALGTTVTFQGNVGGSVPVASLTVNVGSDPESGRIDFQAPNVTAENDITLNPGGRSSVPTVATMFRAAGDLTLESTNGNVIFGPREKLAVADNLQIVAEQAVLSDLVAGQDLTVNANQITVLLREPASVRLSNGTFLQKDRGTDFVASFIDFSETPNGVEIPGVVADDSDMTFGTPTGNDVSSELSGNQIVRRKIFDPERPLSPSDLVLDENGVQTRLDLAPTGLFVSVFKNPNVAGAIIDPRQLGQRPRVTTRPIQAIDILAFLACAPDETGQVPRGCEEVARFEEPVVFEAGSVTGGVSAAPVSTSAAAPPPPLDKRLQTPEAKQSGALYQDLYRTEAVDVEQGRVGVVELSAVDQSARMREEIQGAVDAYRTKTGVATVDPVELARFVESDPSQAGALDTLRKLGELFTSYKAMGLTPIEYRGVTAEQLHELTPEGLSVEELREAIEAAGGGTGRSAGLAFLRRFSRIAAAVAP
jgi:filamentous hemagglutinin family protein